MQEAFVSLANTFQTQFRSDVCVHGVSATNSSIILKCVISFTNPGTTPITILAVNSDHGLSSAGEETQTMVCVSFSLHTQTVLLNSDGSNSPWSEFWSEFPHSMGMGCFPHRQFLEAGLDFVCLVS